MTGPGALRADIQGLRALAVLGVLTFHASAGDWLPGGFARPMPALFLTPRPGGSPDGAAGMDSCTTMVSCGLMARRLHMDCWSRKRPATL